LIWVNYACHFVYLFGWSLLRMVFVWRRSLKAYNLPTIHFIIPIHQSTPRFHTICCTFAVLTFGDHYEHFEEKITMLFFSHKVISFQRYKRAAKLFYLPAFDYPWSLGWVIYGTAQEQCCTRTRVSICLCYKNHQLKGRGIHPACKYSPRYKLS